MPSMNNFKIFLVLLLGLSLHGCLLEDEGLTQIDDVAAPSDLSLRFTIANDNSGRVTLIPNGTGVTAYTLDFGDGSGQTTELRPGETDEYVYDEGVYTVTMVAMGISGLTTEYAQELTVSFQTPENLNVTIARTPGDPLSVDVSATADLETNFEVYFGEVENEDPTIFLEGETVTYTYGDIGQYEVRVIARSGGAAFAEYVDTVNITVPIELPLDFESTVAEYNFVNFGGAESTVVDNPDPSEGNMSSRVGRLTKTNGSEVWAGSFIELGSPIDFSDEQAIRIKTWSPKAGIPILMKLENAVDGSIFAEVTVTNTVANAWEELVFDFSEANLDNEYQKVVIFFDFGTNGDGSAYYFDEVDLTDAPNVEKLTLPLGFESTELDYSFISFGGANAEVIDNPDPSGANLSARVGRLNKGNGSEVWAGSLIDLDDPIDFSATQTIKVKTWSPQAGIPVLLKIENTADANQFIEVFANTTVANQWEELSFDFSTGNLANPYDRLVIFFDFGTAGTGADYYFDDFALAGTEVLSLPLTFESAELAYEFIGFGGAGAEVIDNPDPSGINTSARVGALTKGQGAEVWAGSLLELPEPIDFQGRSKLRLKVWSPAAGIDVLLKFENQDDPGVFIELPVPTTVANAWEELEFDFGSIDGNIDYQKAVFFFDFGNAGSGLTYYFDDLQTVD